MSYQKLQHSAHKILRLPDVICRTGLSKSTLYELIKQNEFVPQIRLGKRSVGWLESAIDAWIEERASKTNGGL